MCEIPVLFLYGIFLIIIRRYTGTVYMKIMKIDYYILTPHRLKLENYNRVLKRSLPCHAIE